MRTNQNSATHPFENPSKENTFCVPNGYDEFFSCQCIIDHHQDSNGNCVRSVSIENVLTACELTLDSDTGLFEISQFFKQSEISI